MKNNTKYSENNESLQMNSIDGTESRQFESFKIQLGIFFLIRLYLQGIIRDSCLIYN